MASSGYYHGGNSQHNNQQPYYDPQSMPPSYPHEAPSYSSGQPGYATPYSANSYGQPGMQHQGGPSPFDTVFDDQAYPTNSRTNLGAHPGDISQQPSHQHYNDTSYYGGGGIPSPGPQPNDGIPLQDRSGKTDGVTDHVYDATGQPPVERSKQKRVRLGELGMLGAGKNRIPFVVYTFTLIQIAVFIAEIAKNGILTGSPIMIKPQFNPMIGPSTWVLINMGARYTPCMHNIPEIQGSKIEVQFQCPNATSVDDLCPLSELCGFGGVPNPVFDGNFDQNPRPNQWFRFITPIFMHAGLIHIGFNMLLQMTIGKEMEQAIGSIRFFLVYMSAGIFGFIMGGNFAAPGIASTGASGALFGIIALTLIDLLYSWKDRRNPVKDLMFIILDMVIAFVLGLLPGLDNFSHIGGFLMGLCLGVCVLHSPNALRKRLDYDTSYSAVDNGAQISPSFMKSPLGFFKGRKPLWWAWWLVRAALLITIIVVFIVLLNQFYTSRNTCKWCKYLSCLPVKNWCEIGEIQINEKPQ